jgi:hypothetical protein
MKYLKQILLVLLWSVGNYAFAQDDIYITPTNTAVSKKYNSYFDFTKGNSKLLLIQRSSVNATFFDYDNTAYNLGSEFQDQTNYSNYVGLEYRFSDRFAMQVEAGFNIYSSRFEFTDGFDTAAAEPIVKRRKYNVQYFTVPVTGKFRIYEIGDEVFSVYVLPSVYFGFRQRGNIQVNETPLMDPDIYYEIGATERYAPTLISGSVGIEFNTRILPYLYLHGQARFISSFTNMNEGFFPVRFGTGNAVNIPIYPSAGQLSLGIQVRLW